MPNNTRKGRTALTEKAKTNRDEIEGLEAKSNGLNRRSEDWLLRILSIPCPEVPVGKGEEQNAEVRKVGIPRKFDF